jgi:hypothetical protein
VTRSGTPTYPSWLQSEFGSIIDDLDLDPERKRFLRARWLDQLAWVEGKAVQAQRRYYALRLTTIVGAVLVPALVSVNSGHGNLDAAARVATWVVSIVVAVSAAVEQFFHFGERWRNYRQSAERLKGEGWLFLQLSGPYSGNGASHESAYLVFASRVEELLRADVDVYLTEIVVEKARPPSRDGPG